MGFLKKLLKRNDEGYDTYTPFKSIGLKHIKFVGSKYIVYQGGKITEQKKARIQVNVKPEKGEDSNTYFICDLVGIEDRLFYSNTYFDAYMTGDNHKFLCKIPQKVIGGNTCIGISMFQKVGATRAEYSFKQNEPYFMKFFYRNEKLVKINLSFNDPEYLIEIEV